VVQSFFLKYEYAVPYNVIENEYGPERRAMGAAGHAYINWAANMAVELGTGVPWVETDAPDPMVRLLDSFVLQLFMED
ncbi:hypothetical protein HN51_050871, partial [Arachis hypogaea]